MVAAVFWSISLPLVAGDSKPRDITKYDQHVFVVSHRAVYKSNPENSISSIKDCIAGGVDAVEVDVRRTKDGQLVLMHDSNVRRTTDGKGNVSSLTLEKIQSLRLKKHTRELMDERVPTLEEALRCCKDKIYVDLDLKGVSIEECMPVIKKVGCESIILYRGSYSLEEAEKITKKYPKIHYVPRFNFRKGRSTLAWPKNSNGIEYYQSHIDTLSSSSFDIGFNSLDHPAVSKEMIEALNKLNIRTWALTLRVSNYGGFVDRNTAVAPEKVWGELLDRGFSIIMTDKAEDLIKYLKAIDRH